MSAVKVSTTINGDPVDYVCEPDETLLDVLRNRLGLTGAKEGCSTGDCGACSVTLDGRLTCSCLVLGAEAEGCDIGTIEGMAQGDKLQVVERFSLDNGLRVARSFFTPLAEHTRRALADVSDDDLAAAHRTFTAVIDAMRAFRDELDAMPD